MLNNTPVDVSSTLIGRTTHPQARMGETAVDVAYRCPACGRHDRIAFLEIEDVGPLRFHHSCGQSLRVWPPGGEAPKTQAPTRAEAARGGFWTGKG